jgi:hypothetical protein
MKPIYYLFAVDLIVLVVVIKLIFGSYSVFIKSVEDYFFPDNFFPDAKKKFAEQNDTSYKLNLFYASIMVLLGLNLIAYAYLFS